jgi:hypothetical protein
MKAHERTHRPTMSQEEGPGRPMFEVYHIHYGPGAIIKAVFHRRAAHDNRWVASKVYPLPQEISRHSTAHEALEAIGADPREILGAGALKRAGIE